MAWLGRLFGALLAGSSAHGVVLPEDRAEALLHTYDGGGVKANGPAFLVRKSMADKVSISGSYYVDAVSNASIDVVTTASPFKETRTAVGLGADYLVRDSLLSLSLESSREPDYTARSIGLDISQDMFAAMTTVSLGFTRSSDEVGKKDIGFFDQATHWQYRAGLTQILSPRWLASLNFEAVADSGYLGSPYRAARVFGALVPERNPRTRSSRALQLRTVGDVGDAGSRMAVRASFRHYWDNWKIRAETLDFGASRYFGERWLADAQLRLYSQTKALFFSDDATSETLYVSRNRQLGSFKSTAFTARLSYRFDGAAAKYGTQLSGAYELRRFRYSDFTDLRSKLPYSFNANVLQAYVSANF